MSATLRSLTLATAGHVDHGKSSLVRQITGVDTDTLAEEKTRGLTINLGFAYRRFDDPAGQVTSSLAFVDVPGHMDFTANMLAGVGLVDSCLLVVAADDGVMPQTREHALILDLLGVSQGCVVLSKIDCVDTQRRQQVRKDLQTLLRDTSLDRLPVLEVSSVSGEGVPELVDFLRELTLAQESQPEDPQHFPRFAVDRSFTVAGIGTVLTGTLISGSIRNGDPLQHNASGRTVRIRQLRHDRDVIDRVSRGQRAALNVDAPHQLFRRGDELLAAAVAQVSTRMDVRLRLAEGVSLRQGRQYHLHLGSAHHIVKVTPLGEKASDYYQLVAQEPLRACVGDRVILRNPAATATLAGGRVVDPMAPKRHRHSPAHLQYLRDMDQPDGAALAALLRHQEQGVCVSRFGRDRNLTASAVATLHAALPPDVSAAVEIHLEPGGEPVLLGGGFLGRHAEQIQSLLQAYHQANPFRPGMNDAELANRFNPMRLRALVPGLLRAMEAKQMIRRDKHWWRMPSFQQRVDPQQRAFLQRIQPLLTAAGFTAPRVGELQQATGLSPGSLEKQLTIARQTRQLIQVADNRYYLPETLDALANFIVVLANKLPPGSGFTVQQFRDASGIGRNLCIELLEYFDTVGLTRRDDNFRFLRKGKNQPV